MKSILKLKPAFKDYLWGGHKLMHEYGVSGMTCVAEAWVLSAHPDGPSIVDGGEADGRLLSDLLPIDFPVLIKLIDAQKDLSVQVHPDDVYAAAEGQLGKTEMWYILDAEDGAGIYYGFKEAVTKEQFQKSIVENTLNDLLEFVPVKKGESYFIPAGTIHAIGKGLMIAEIQQSSNLTYRVYDYGRRDSKGNTRPLHIEKALEVTKLEKAQREDSRQTIAVESGTITRVADCPYFRVDELAIDGTVVLPKSDGFVAVLIISGTGSIEGTAFGKYDTFYIPEGYGEVELSGHFTALVSHL